MADPLTCSGCHKRYRWKPQYAGLKVQCPCGQYLLMPRQDPAASQEQSPSPAPASISLEPQAAQATRRQQTVEHRQAAVSSSVIDLDMPEPARAAPAANEDDSDEAPLELAITTEEVAPVHATPSQAYLQAMSSRPSAVAQALMNREDEVAPSFFKEKLFPAMVAIAGIIAQIVLWFVFATSPGRAVAGSSLMLLAETLLMAPIAVGAVLLVAKIMDIGFGPMIPALIRVCAIAIGAGGVADLLFFKVMLSVDFDYQILLVGFVLHMILIGIPVAIVFELESLEMAAIVSIIVLPRIFILYGLGYMFPHWF